jgi:large subunit ribosomal protein L18
VYRSNRYIYAQAIDDVNKVTVGSSSSVVIKSSKVKVEDSTKSGVAKEVGKKLASVLKKKGIDKTVFDRNKYAYSGRVKALADGLREGGIKV